MTPKLHSLQEQKKPLAVLYGHSQSRTFSSPQSKSLKKNVQHFYKKESLSRSVSLFFNIKITTETSSFKEERDMERQGSSLFCSFSLGSMARRADSSVICARVGPNKGNELSFSFFSISFHGNWYFPLEHC